MARGKPLNINQIKLAICKELIGHSHKEISHDLGLHPQTIDRVKKRDDYHAIRKHLSDSLMRMSSSELLRIQ